MGRIFGCLDEPRFSAKRFGGYFLLDMHKRPVATPAFASGYCWGGKRGNRTEPLNYKYVAGFPCPASVLALPRERWVTPAS